MAPHASLLVSLGLPALALLALTLVMLLIARAVADDGRSARRFALGAGAWLAVTGVLAASGLLARFELRPPPLLAVMLPTLALPIVLARSRIGAALADHAPLAGLIGFQAFRLPLELVMHEAAVEGVMPPQMTFTGSNYDIVSGGTALLVALAAAGGYAPRWLIVLWNALGSLLLLNILVIALASLPQVAAFGSDPAHVNTWVAYFPYVWLPAGLVTSALFGHAVVWRKLVRDARRVSSGAQSTSLA